jgi:hypothetical protein
MIAHAPRTTAEAGRATRHAAPLRVEGR